MGGRVRIEWGAWLLPAAAIAAAGPAKPPRDAPYCATPGTAPLFVAPGGEPFRAASGRPYPSSAWFAAADRNGDGLLDRAETVADADRFFRTLDKDGDHRLSPDEVAGYETAVAPEINVYAGRREPDRASRGARPVFASMETPGYGGPLGAGRFAWLNIPEPVAAADADVDRVVTEAEYMAAGGRRCDALDARGAGRLRFADLPRTPQQAAIEGPCRPRPRPSRRDREEAADREDMPR